MPAESGGPFVAAALLCESVSPRPDGAIDILGVVDGLAVSPREPLQGPLTTAARALVELTALVSIRAGTVRGTHQLGLQGTFPSGRVGPAIARPVELTDDRPAAHLVVPLELPVVEGGTYLFNVLFDGETLTRIELHIDLLPNAES